MSEQLQKPFLTIETGEAYQPIRLTYSIVNKEQLDQTLSTLGCLEKTPNGIWNWFWKSEAEDIPFESIDAFQRNLNIPLRIGTLTIRDEVLHLNISSFKRACLAVPFFHRAIDPSVAQVHHADFLNKVYGLDERLPHGFAELFKEDELLAILSQRTDEFHAIQESCENANSIEDALAILKEYTDRESHKKLPFAERYAFDLKPNEDPDLIFLAFYIFLRGRELVAIRRWFGETAYTLADAAEDTVEKVFGGVGVDLID